MTPLDYVADNVHITSSRKLLYNCVFNKFRNEDATSNGKYQRKISGKVFCYTSRYILVIS